MSGCGVWCLDYRPQFATRGDRAPAFAADTVTLTTGPILACCGTQDRRQQIDAAGFSPVAPHSTRSSWLLHMIFTTLKRPSALIPLAMSFAALSVVLGHIAIFGVTHETDEGTAAHVWQLLMAGQIPVIAFFALKWLPRSPREALLVLLLQAVAGLAAATPVFVLKL